MSIPSLTTVGECAGAELVCLLGAVCVVALALCFWRVADRLLGEPGSSYEPSVPVYEWSDEQIDRLWSDVFPGDDARVVLLREYRDERETRSALYGGRRRIEVGPVSDPARDGADGGFDVGA